MAGRAARHGAAWAAAWLLLGAAAAAALAWRGNLPVFVSVAAALLLPLLRHAPPALMYRLGLPPVLWYSTPIACHAMIARAHWQLHGTLPLKEEAEEGAATEEAVRRFLLRSPWRWLLYRPSLFATPDDIEQGRGTQPLRHHVYSIMHDMLEDGSRILVMPTRSAAVVLQAAWRGRNQRRPRCAVCSTSIAKEPCTHCGRVSWCARCSEMCGVGAKCPRCPPEEKETVECVVCMEARATHAYARCGHRCACAGCVAISQEPAGNIHRCPMCREESFEYDLPPVRVWRAPLCVVCRARAPTHMLDLCGHQCACAGCARECQGRCPLCRRAGLLLPVFD